ASACPLRRRPDAEAGGPSPPPRAAADRCAPSRWDGLGKVIRTSRCHRNPAVAGSGDVMGQQKVNKGMPGHPSLLKAKRLNDTVGPAGPRAAEKIASTFNPKVEGDAVAVVHGQRVEDALPAGDLAGQVLAILALLRRDEVEDLQRGLLGREVSAVADGASEGRVAPFGISPRSAPSEHRTTLGQD